MNSISTIVPSKYEATQVLEEQPPNAARGNNVRFVVAQNGAGCSPPDAADQKIEQSISYMMRNLNRPLHIAALSAQANISPSHYFALFKRQTGFAPIEFFIRLRMRKACALLRETSMSVKEVAAALGYDDPFYFSRIFKSVVSLAPTEYRTNQRQMSSFASGE